MRERGHRSAGRGRGWIVAGSAIAALVAAGLWPSAEATPTRVQALGAMLRAPAGESRKAIAIDELRKIDSSAARTELQSLADSADKRLAMLAIRALGRTGTSGAGVDCRIHLGCSIV